MVRIGNQSRALVGKYGLRFFEADPVFPNIHLGFTLIPLKMKIFHNYIVVIA